MKKLLAILMSVLFFTQSVCSQSAKAMLNVLEGEEFSSSIRNVTEDQFRYNLKRATELMRSSEVPRLGMALDLQGEVAIIGDIHGDSDSADVICSNLQDWVNTDKDRKVLFLGDIFDRGNSTTLTLNRVLDFYIKNHERVFILKGNHETKSYFNSASVALKSEVMIQKCKDEICNYFDVLPYAAIINNTTFASHAGFPSIELSNIRCPIDWRDFFKEKDSKEDKEVSEYWESVLLWPDCMEGADKSKIELRKAYGRAPFFIKDIKEFLAEANKIEFPNGRRLDLQNVVVGHNHENGPFSIVDLGDGQTFYLLISTTRLMRQFYAIGGLKREFLEMPQNEVCGCVLVVDKNHRIKRLFQVRTRFEVSRKVEGCQVKESEEKVTTNGRLWSWLENIGYIFGLKKSNPEEKHDVVEVKEDKVDEVDMRYQVTEITPSNVNDMCSVITQLENTCKIDKDKVLFLSKENLMCARKAPIRMLPLAYAIMTNNPECVDVLINMGANVKGQDDQGNTALHYAVFGDKLDIRMVKLLLEKGADPFIKNGDGKTACDCANDLMCDYIKKYVNICEMEKASRSVDILREELDEIYKKIEIEEGKRREGKVRIEEESKKERDRRDAEFEKLSSSLRTNVKAHVELPKRETLYVGESTTEGNLRNVVFKITSENINCELKAFYGNADGSVEKCELIRDNVVCFTNTFNLGSILCCRYVLPLGYATILGNRECVEALLYKGADINGQDSYGNTALHYAAESNNQDLVKFLIENGARIDIKNKKEKTAVDVATKEMAEFIMRYNHDIVIIRYKCITQANINDLIRFNNQPRIDSYYKYNGEDHGTDLRGPFNELVASCYGGVRIAITPLIYAVQRNDFDFVKRLIEMGANVNGQDEQGNTVLCYATSQGNDKIVEFLIDHGADKSIHNN